MVIIEGGVWKIFRKLIKGGIGIKEGCGKMDGIENRRHRSIHMQFTF